MTGKRRLCYPACYANPAAYICRVIYDPYRGWEEVLFLCPECRNTVRRWARRKGYAFRSLRMAQAQ